MGEIWENYAAICGEYLPLILKGVTLTLKAAGLGTLFGTLLALLLSILPVLLPPPFSRGTKAVRTLLALPVRLYGWLFRSIPFLFQAALLHYGIAAARGTPPLPLFSGTLALTLCSGAYLLDPFRDAVEKCREGGGWERVCRFLLPLLDRFGENAKDTAVLHMIGVTGLYFSAGVIHLQGHPLFESYLMTAIPYLGISFLLWCVSVILKKCAARTKPSAPSVPDTPDMPDVQDTPDVSDTQEE